MANILLVEDTEELGRVVVRELEAAGHGVRWARDGESALTLHAAQPPDLVLLDWMLPGIARGEETDRVLGLELGADDYLTKPFSLRELMARVRAVLRRVELVREQIEQDRRPAASALRYGPLTLDDEAHRATLDGEPLELSVTEFNLLELLLRHPGRAFSRSYLLDTVWGVEYVGGDRSVDNAVLRLRKKLGPLGEQIETVWGVGYRLRPVGAS